MKINFAKDCWTTDEIDYAYSYRFEATPVFVQKEDHVENKPYGDGIYDYDNISVLTKKKFRAGVKTTTHCAFEKLGAPLIVIADKIYTDKNGVLRYGDYIEIVLYKNGMNVWRMYMKDEQVTWKNLVRVKFPVSEGEVHELSTEISEDLLKITAAGQEVSLYVPGLYPEFHLGIDACEGINRFYDIEIEEIKG